MNADTARLAHRFLPLLAQQESFLRARLWSACDDAAFPSGPMDRDQMAGATKALGGVIAARLRMEEGRYGLCLSCGEPINLLRLTLLPAAPDCTACGSLDEYGDALALPRHPAQEHRTQGRLS